MNQSFKTYSIEETEKIGSDFMKTISGPVFVALYGDLGAGKTAFVRGMIHGIDDSINVTSPTYTVVNEYELKGIKLAHFDMYRITDDDDLFSVGFYDYLGSAIVVSEWCENIPYAIPEHYIKIEIKKDIENDNIRYISMEEIRC